MIFRWLSTHDCPRVERFTVNVNRHQQIKNFTICDLNFWYSDKRFAGPLICKVSYWMFIILLKLGSFT